MADDTKKTAKAPSKQAQPIAITDADWATIKPASSYADAYDKIKALLYGPTKTGKSTTAAKFRRPLVGLTELQAIPSYVRANPAADVFPIRDPLSLFKFMQMAQSAHARGYDAVVADSISDIQRIIRQYFTRRPGSRAGQEKTSQESWGLIIDATAKLARDLRDLPIHVVAICLDEEHRPADGDGVTVHRPLVSGKKLPNDLCQYFNVVGYTSLREREHGFRHEVLFRADERYLVGAPNWLDPIEPPEPEYWISKMTGTPPPPDVKARVDAWRELDSLVASDDEDGDDDVDADAAVAE